jgi:beta-N-acetylhexosaminidase
MAWGGGILSPPLSIATDQEGGVVSRLSPPLTRLPPIAQIVERHPDPPERRAAVRQYAQAQARDLAQVGGNLNLAPVLDLNRVSSIQMIDTRASISEPSSPTRRS